MRQPQGADFQLIFNMPRQWMGQEGVVHDDGGRRAKASPELRAAFMPLCLHHPTSPPKGLDTGLDTAGTRPVAVHA